MKLPTLTNTTPPGQRERDMQEPKEYRSSRYELIREADDLVNELLEAEGEVDDFIAQRIEKLDAGMAEKMQAYSDIVDSLDWKIARLKAEAKRLNEMAASCERNLKATKKWAMDVLEARVGLYGWKEGSKHKLCNGTVFLTRRSRTKWVDEQQILDEYCGTDFVQVSFKVDKHAVTEALKAGKKVNGAVTEEYLSISFK